MKLEFVPRASAVKQPLLQGVQPVAAVWFPADWYAEPERARRLLAQWRPGSVALRFAQGDLLRFAEPIEMPCDALGGWPLRIRGHGLCSAPMTAAEAADAPAADVWIVEGGQVTGLNLADGQALDPARWLAVDGHALHDTYDCREALPVMVDVGPPEARALRDVLNGKVPAPSEEQREFLRQMAERTSGRPTGTDRQAGRSGRVARASGGNGFLRSVGAIGGRLSIGVAVLAALTLLRSSLEQFSWPGLLVALLVAYVVWSLLTVGTAWVMGGKAAFGAGAAADGAKKSGGGKSAGGEIPARQAKSKPQAWRDWLARLAITSQVSRLLGRRQAAYMRKMMELFESGKLEEALRHAIPLGGDAGSLGQAFGTPGPREDLSLTRSVGARTSIHLGNDLNSYLRRLYRQSFEKLDREGRIDEAVFVLAELLEAKLEALDYLEKHGRHAQAAELALAWEQPADVIVRLHCLAGDWRRAVAVARRDNAFASAVLQLEKKWPDVAARLREEWAQALAARGDWLGALDVIWPLAGRRQQAVAWLMSAEAAGGRLSAAALVKRAVLLLDTLQDCVARLQELRDDPDAHAQRNAMAQAILALKEKHPGTVQLARIIGPPSVADHAAGSGALVRNDLQRLLTLGGDRLHEVDLPTTRLPAYEAQPLAQRNEALTGVVPDAGNLGLCDVAALDDGRYLVALGEAGAAIVDQHGKVVVRFAVPAYRIVIAHSRQVALVMAPRDQLWRVSRLDLTHRRVTDLGVAELGYVASEFDGIAWTVLEGSRLRVLDTQRSLQEVLWQVADLPGNASGLSTQAALEQVVMANDKGQLELWRYRLPQRRLISRGELVPDAPVERSLRLLNPDGGVLDVWCGTDDQGGAVIHHRQLSSTYASPVAGVSAVEGVTVQARAGSGWLMAGLNDGASVHWQLLSLNNHRPYARLTWPASARPQVRLQAGHCLVFDGEGRLWDVDVASGATKGLTLRS